MSEESNGAQPRRVLRPLSPDQWRLARIQFETGDREITHDRIAQIFQTSVSSVHKRAAAEKWSKTNNIVAKARNQLKDATERQIALATESASKEIVKSLLDDLQPFIEKEKRAQIQRAIKRAKRAQKRLDKIADGYEVQHPKSGQILTLPCSPKDEMHLATAEDKYDNILRRNLGMGDSGAQQGPINMTFLSNPSAVQIVQK